MGQQGALGGPFDLSTAINSPNEVALHSGGGGGTSGSDSQLLQEIEKGRDQKGNSDSTLINVEAEAQVLLARLGLPIMKYSHFVYVCRK